MSVYTLPEIREDEASPEIALIYRDMKAVMGLPMVNLIYRYVATLPGCLPWVWSIVRPHFLSGAMERASAELRDGLALPSLVAIKRQELIELGIDFEAETMIRRMIDAYNRGNSANLISLMAIRLGLDGEVPVTVAVDEEPAATIDALPLPSIPARSDLDPETAITVRALTSLHESAGESVIPSLYLHLAHWPVFLVLAKTRLNLVASNLVVAREETGTRARDQAEQILPALRATHPMPKGEQRKILRQELDRFTSGLIPEMINVGLMLRGAMG